jgi:electron transport complex protein RnfD
MSRTPREIGPRAGTFVVAPGPHVHGSETTSHIMWWVNGALAPAALWGVLVFGVPALLVMVAGIAGAAAGEQLGTRMLGRTSTLRDGSAVCTGLLLALTLPPLFPPWAAFLGGVFGIVFAKTLFGGLGYNLFNPALVARAFLTAAFPLPMATAWAPPHAAFAAPLDAATTVTPLAVLREQGLGAAFELIRAPGGPWSGLVLGLRPGSIGEVSVVLIALGAAVLLARGIIGLTIPLSVFAGLLIVTAPTGAAGLHLLSGGLWLGAFFMATDYVTSPSTQGGRIVFGVTIGAIAGLIRLIGGYPEGICYAILLANALVPALNLWFRPRRMAMAGAPS